MRSHAQEVLSNEFGEYEENRSCSIKFRFYADKLEDIFLNKLPKELHKLYNDTLECYYEYYSKMYNEFEEFFFDFLKKVFNPRRKRMLKK